MSQRLPAPWRDSTSYSQGERGDREPDAWEMQLLSSRMRIVLHVPRWNRETWAVTVYWCGGALIDGAELATTDLGEAARLAGAAVVAKLERAIVEMQSLPKDVWEAKP